MAFEIMPEVFDRIEFGAVGWKFDERHVVRYFELPRSMESRTVPDHDGMFVVGQCPRKLLQEDIDHVRVESRTQKAFGLPCLGTHGTDHPEVIVLGLTHGLGTRTLGRPHARQCPLLSESRFILKEYLQAFAWSLGGNLLELLRKLFLKAACASGFALRCWGRGASDE